MRPFSYNYLDFIPTVMKNSEKKEKSAGFVIFSKILENKKEIEKRIKEGRSISKIKGVKIAKPI